MPCIDLQKHSFNFLIKNDIHYTFPMWKGTESRHVMLEGVASYLGALSEPPITLGWLPGLLKHTFWKTDQSQDVKSGLVTYLWLSLHCSRPLNLKKNHLDNSCLVWVVKLNTSQRLPDVEWFCSARGFIYLMCFSCENAVVCGRMPVACCLALFCSGLFSFYLQSYLTLHCRFHEMCLFICLRTLCINAVGCYSQKTAHYWMFFCIFSAFLCPDLLLL